MKESRIRSKYGVVATICIINIFVATIAVSQNQFPSEIRIGVRTAADSIGSVYRDAGKVKLDGYCKLFGQELEQEFQNHNLSVKVSYTDINNEYKGRSYPRYDGLKLKNASNGKKSLIDIECGPNSRPVHDSDWDKWSHVIFSDTFHRVNIKLLLREKLFNELNNISLDSLEQRLKSVKIGVTKNTVTISKLQNADYYYLGFETKEKLIEALHNGEVEAYANDSPILETLIQREFKNKGFFIFPKYGTLPNLQKDEYVIAISKTTNYSGQLLSIINDVLKQPRLTKYIKELEKKDFDNKNLNQKRDSINKYDHFKMLVLGFILGVTVIAIFLMFLLPELRRKFTANLVIAVSSTFSKLLNIVVDLFRRNI